MLSTRLEPVEEHRPTAVAEPYPEGQWEAPALRVLPSSAGGRALQQRYGTTESADRFYKLFVDFFRDVIGLHVNGRADIVEDTAMRAAFPALPMDPVPGRRPNGGSGC